MIDRLFSELSAAMPAIVTLIEKACILVTLAFLLTRTGLFPSQVRTRMNLREQSLAAGLFLVIGFAEVVGSSTAGLGATAEPLLNLRIVAAAAAGLLAGPWVGLIVGVMVTVIAIGFDQRAPFPIATSMVIAGLAGGMLSRWNSRLATRPVTGFLFGVATSLFRDGLNFVAGSPGHSGFVVAIVGAVLRGIAVSLILIVIEQVRDQETQARAAAFSEVRALQARMDPHFLFNSLNTLAALSQLDPLAVPKATAHLGLFLRASLDQHDRPLVPLKEEIAVVNAYLEIETMRTQGRIRVECNVPRELLTAQVPPFLLQILVENAVRHGVEPTGQLGTVRVDAQVIGNTLCLSVSDTGKGMTPTTLATLFESENGHIHALELLRRRLSGLFGTQFQFSVESHVGEGTWVTVWLPFIATSTTALVGSESPLAQFETPSVTLTGESAR